MYHRRSLDPAFDGSAPGLPGDWVVRLPWGSRSVSSLVGVQQMCQLWWLWKLLRSCLCSYWYFCYGLSRPPRSQILPEAFPGELVEGNPCSAESPGLHPKHWNESIVRRFAQKARILLEVGKAEVQVEWTRVE